MTTTVVWGFLPRISESSLVTSRLAYGCMRIAGPPGRARADALPPARAAIRAALEAGYTHFDHADIYGDGRCEELFGCVLKETPGLRDRVLVASKCGIRWRGDPDDSVPHRWDFSREHVVRSCEGSLRRLGTDHLDLYMLHRPDYLADPEEIAGAFAGLKAQGKVREFGSATSGPHCSRRSSAPAPCR